MADEVDRANDISEDHRTVGIKSISREVDRKSGATHCDECEREIPLARRLAYPSTILCISCKEQEERDSRIYRR